MKLEKSTALVTGGGSGLGAATAHHFASLGAYVAVLDLDAAAARSVADEIGGIAVIADVSDEKSVDAAVEQAQQMVENPYLNGTAIRLDGAVRLPPR